MGYLLLTGATGLLGSYLIRDLLGRGTRLAVLVRATKIASARQRVENLIARWETEAGRALPRPIVLEGDLSQPDLGLGPRGVQWAARNCRAFMHNAASLTFHAEQGRDGEPYRSNLNGTRNVLEFCEQADLREFHHVSTAYVCGKRLDRVLESELDVGQELGNDYEISKFESERLVRSADFLKSVTVYRPGIIVGDSFTGFTTTFHGFYVPLKLVSTLMKRTAAVGLTSEQIATPIRIGGNRLRQVLKLTGKEHKNLVPVDWVSAVMSHVYCNRDHHGKTYHLTPRQRVPVKLMQQTIEDAFIKYTVLTSKATETAVNWADFEQHYTEQMRVYQSYWGDDPEFDCTNTLDAAPHLPCPDMDRDLLMRQCRFAIESNFGWPKPGPANIEFDVHDHLAELTHDRRAGEANGSRPRYLGLQVNGRGGGQWELLYERGRVVAADVGLGSRCTATFYLNTNTFRDMTAGDTTAEQAVNRGHVLIEGNGVPLPKLTEALQEIATGNGNGRAVRPPAGRM
ncbi:MAG: SDR family oxidoreductase [Planctomycetaceae bacterium]